MSNPDSNRSSAKPDKDPIDLFRGWPNPSLLPVDALAKSAAIALSTPPIYEPGLQYGPDEGYAPLRQHIATLLNTFYRFPSHTAAAGLDHDVDNPISASRIVISGGASQNLACILQVYTDAAYTRNIWMVAPTYYLACRIFHDAGFMNRLRGVPEDAQGIDLEFLEKGLEEAERKAAAEGNTEPVRLILGFFSTQFTLVFLAMADETLVEHV